MLRSWADNAGHIQLSSRPGAPGRPLTGQHVKHSCTEPVSWLWLRSWAPVGWSGREQPIKFLPAKQRSTISFPLIAGEPTLLQQTEQQVPTDLILPPGLIDREIVPVGHRLSVRNRPHTY